MFYIISPIHFSLLISYVMRWLRIWLAVVPSPFVHKSCLLKRASSSSTLSSTSPSTLPPLLFNLNLSIEILPFLFNFFIILSFNSPISSSTSPTMAESSQKASPSGWAHTWILVEALIPKFTTKRRGGPFCPWQKSQQKKAKQLLKHGVPSIQSI